MKFRTLFLLIAVLLLFGGCDPTVSLAFKVLNQTGQQISVKVYGSQWYSSRVLENDSTAIESGESKYIWGHDSDALDYDLIVHSGKIWAFDSLKISYNGVTSPSIYRDAERWILKTGKRGRGYELIITEDDFAIE